MKKIEWKKIISSVRIGIVGIFIVYIFGLYKKSSVNGLPALSKENLKEMAIDLIVMIACLIVLTCLTKIYDKWKKDK